VTAYLDMFSGIGGFALAAYWAGLRFNKHFFSEAALKKRTLKLHQPVEKPTKRHYT